MPSPPAHTRSLQIEDFLESVLPRPTYKVGGIRGQLPPNLFCTSHILLYLQKFLSIIW